MEIAGPAVASARQILVRADQAFTSATAEYGPEAQVGFPNTGYFLPIIYGLTGLKAVRLADLAEVLSLARRLVPLGDPSALQQALDAGMAAMLAGEVIEAIRYLRQREYYGAPAARAL
ncbi:MAG: hypothetical protein ACUVRC_09265 [Desulfotomaculales bacterium]